MFCPKCGNELEEIAKFCWHCGYKLEKEEIDSYMPGKRFIHPGAPLSVLPEKHTQPSFLFQQLKAVGKKTVSRALLIVLLFLITGIMSSWGVLIIIGSLAFIVGLIMLIVNAGKKLRKQWGVVAVSGVVLFIIGGVMLPTFTISSFNITPKEVAAGKNVVISADVENIGIAEGTYRAILMIDGVEVETKNIIVAGGAKETIQFIITGNTLGIHKVELGGLADAFSVLRPAEFKVSELIITPNQVNKGKNAAANVRIENIGEAEGTYPLSLLVNGKVEQTKAITLKGGATEEVAFIISKDSPGSYSIEMGIQKKTLKVVQPERLRTGTYVVGWGPICLYPYSLCQGGDLTIENGLALDAVVVLADATKPNIPSKAVYIRSKESYTINTVGTGFYIVYFTYGEDWDSYSKEFTQYKTYEQFENTFDFGKYSYKITLHTVPGGTAKTKYISEGQFPRIG